MCKIDHPDLHQGALAERSGTAAQNNSILHPAQEEGASGKKQGMITYI